MCPSQSVRGFLCTYQLPPVLTRCHEVVEVFRIHAVNLKQCTKVDRISTLDFASVPDRRLCVRSTSIQGDYVALRCDSFAPGSVFLVLIEYATNQIIYSAETHFWVRPSLYFHSGRAILTSKKVRFRPDVKIIQNHLFYLCASTSSAPSSLIRTADLRELFARRGEWQKGQDEDDNRPLIVDIEALGFTDYEVKPPDGFVVSSMSLPSLCTYHWKAPKKRFDQITIMLTVAATVDDPPLFITNRYAFAPRPSTQGDPVLKFISSTSPTRPSVLGQSKWTNCGGATLALSGASLLSFRECMDARGSPVPKGRFISTLTADDGRKADSTLEFSAVDVERWTRPDTQNDIDYLSETSTRYTHCNIDYLSGALLSRVRGHRLITIKYPA